MVSSQACRYMYVHVYMCIYMYIIVQLPSIYTLLGFAVYTLHGPVIAKARLLMCTLDLPAKAIVMNMKQFNGKRGCTYCEDE